MKKTFVMQAMVLTMALFIFAAPAAQADGVIAGIVVAATVNNPPAEDTVNPLYDLVNPLYER